jgi:hypothetical protein
MLYLITKALLSGVIMAASEARSAAPLRSASCFPPLVSILAMVWRDTGDNERIAAFRRERSGLCC